MQNIHTMTEKELRAVRAILFRKSFKLIVNNVSLSKGDSYAHNIR